MQIKTPQEYRITLGKMQMDGYQNDDITKTLPFNLEAEDFINYAKLDIKGNTDRDFVNALSNIKRAIENRMDGILFAFKYQKIAKDWNFPDKVNRLNGLGIISPRILRKINRIRNLLEHQYRIPKKREVEDAYDVAILFIAYTKNFIKKFVMGYGCYTEKKGEVKTYLDLKFEDKGLKIRIDQKEYYVEASDPNYDEWIGFIIKLCY